MFFGIPLLFPSMNLFVVWCGIVCGVEFDDEDVTVLLQTKIVQEHVSHSVASVQHKSDVAQFAKSPNYDEVWELPYVDRCSPHRWKYPIPGCSFKTETEAQAACNGNPDCQGYYASGEWKVFDNDKVIDWYSAEVWNYFLLLRRARSWAFYGFGAPTSKVLHVFAKDAGSDLVKLGVSKAKYDYTAGECKRCAQFGIRYLTSGDAQAACDFVGAHCVGYWKSISPGSSDNRSRIWLDPGLLDGYFLLGFGLTKFSTKDVNARIQSVMLKGRGPVIAPTKAGATKIAKRAAKKAAKAEQLAAVKASKAAKTAAMKRACRPGTHGNVFSRTFCEKSGYLS